MTWAEAQASLQLEAELRVGAAMRLRRDIAQAAVDGRNAAADEQLRGMLG